MKIGIMILRRGNLKGLGPIITECIARGHTTHLLYDPLYTTGVKAYENVDPSALSHWPEAHLTAAPIQSWPALIQQLRLNYVIGENAYRALLKAGWLTVLPELRQSGLQLASITHLWEVLNEPAEMFETVDTVLYWSEAQQEMHQRISAQVSPEITPTPKATFTVGSTMFDQLALIDRGAVRKRLGVRPGQKIVLFFSLKMGTGDPWRSAIMGNQSKLKRSLTAVLAGHPEWIPGIFQGHGSHPLFQAVRQFCDRNRAFLVVKSKAKNADPDYIRTGADAFCFDETDYPYTSLELMAVADLVIHFGSAAVFEAAFTKTPSISITLPHEHVAKLGRHYAVVMKEFRRPSGKEGIFHWPGVVYGTDPRSFIEQFSQRSFDHYPLKPADCDRYIQRYIGFGDTHASQRVLDAVEQTALASFKKAAVS